MAARHLTRKLATRSHVSRTAPVLFSLRLHSSHRLDLDHSFDANYNNWRREECYDDKSQYEAFLHFRNSMDDEEQRIKSLDRLSFANASKDEVKSFELRNRLAHVKDALGRDWLGRGQGMHEDALDYQNALEFQRGARKSVDTDRMAGVLSERNSGFGPLQNKAFGRSCLAWTGRASIQGSCIGHDFKQSSKLVRFSSNAGEGLQDEMGGLQAGLRDVSNAAVDGSMIGNLGSSQAVSEVAGAIADCSYPTAMLQVLIENVHLYGGLPWWAAIAATTVGIRFLALPVIIYQMKSTARLALMRPELEKINNEIKESGYDLQTTTEGHQRIKAVFKKYKTTPFSPFIGAVLQAPVFMCFFFAIKNMAANVESFKDGGFLWFTDLTTPDSTYILPLLTALSVLITVELGAAEGMEGNPMANKMKTFMRIFAVALFPITVSFEKALFCYWITSNFWSLCQSSVLKLRVVKDAVGLPDLSHLVQEEPSLSKPVVTLSRPTRNVHRRKTSKGSKRR